jgi:prolyl-tRNA synthetase
VLVGRDRPEVPVPVTDLPGHRQLPERARHDVARDLGRRGPGHRAVGAQPAAARGCSRWPCCSQSAIGFTRLALGVHYLSDVLAGWALGAGWLAVTTALFRAWQAEEGRVSPRVGQGLEEHGTWLAPLYDRHPPDGGRALVRLTGTAVALVAVAVALSALAPVPSRPALPVGAALAAVTAPWTLLTTSVAVSVLVLAVSWRRRPALLPLVAVLGAVGVALVAAALLPAGRDPSWHAAAAAAAFGSLAAPARRTGEVPVALGRARPGRGPRRAQRGRPGRRRLAGRPQRRARRDRLAGGLHALAAAARAGTGALPGGGTEGGGGCRRPPIGSRLRPGLSRGPPVLRMSTLFLRTLREDPADAEVPSHRLLVRAGYVRRVAPGIYSWLPLGVRMLANVSRIVREEMDRIGAQEVLFPALLPKEPYEASARWTDYGDLLFRLKDRRGNDYLLGPTHEELFTLMVKGEYSSYKDLPLMIYQVQTKYRDEARPRAGVLRGREFIMKDSYSFDLDDEGLQRSYDLHREAYIRTFERLGMDYRVVSAVSGAMGGSASEEFLAPAPTGEDTFVSCTSCDYAANTEAVELRAAEPRDPAAQPPLQVLDTPDTPTIDTLVAVLAQQGHDVPASGTLKNVVVQLRYPDGKVEPLVVGVPGDREVDVKRLEANVSPAEVLPFEKFDEHPQLVKGYIGPQGLEGIRYVVDPLVVPGSAWATGANEPGRHAVDVVMGRDFTPSGVVPAAEVRAG